MILLHDLPDLHGFSRIDFEFEFGFEISSHMHTLFIGLLVYCII